MHPIDISFITGYFILVIGLGFYCSKRASQNLNAYFLGGNKIHWLGLAMSGSVSNFDITGTMWIVSMLVLLGMKSMWHHWMWGFLMGAFFMSYMGRWVRRSNVLTAAEWMKTRFGVGPDGRLARTAYALMAVLTQAAFIGYAFQGIGKFSAVYIPLEKLAEYTSIPWVVSLLTTYQPHVLAVIIIGITTLYVVMGGLFSVVVTDIIQTIILTIGSLFIAWTAWSLLDAEALARIPDGWASLSVPWTTEIQGFEFFGLMVMVWVVKGLLMNAGGPAQMYDFQRFLSARNPRDAAKVGAAWSCFLLVRWAMAAGIALIAITGIVSGTEDPEKIMPVILNNMLPVGVRGVVIAGLLAAFMSTFSSTVNSGASFIVRDIWQPYFRPDSTERESMKCSHLATILLVVAGIAIGFLAKSISEIWNWLMMALGAGVIIPNVLRWYWWRMNGWGYAAGMFGGMLLSLVVFPPFMPLWVKIGVPEIPLYVSFPVITMASLLASVVVTYCTKPVRRSVLISFYDTIRPFGVWGKIRNDAGSIDDTHAEPTSRIVINCLLGMIAIASLYVAPMYLVGHWYLYASVCAGTGLAAITILKFTWYDTLPEN